MRFRFKRPTGPINGHVHHAGECPPMGEWRASLASKLNYVAQGTHTSSAWASRHQAFSATHRLNSLEPFELRVPKIERLVVAGFVMRGAESFGLGPWFKAGAVLPHRAR